MRDVAVTRAVTDVLSGPMNRAIIFDLDGTLVDSCGICVDILSGMLSERGSDHVIDRLGARTWMSVGGEAMIAALLGPACGSPEEDLVEFRARYRDTLTPVEALYPGVSEGLHELRRAGFRMAICSNKPQDLCEQTLIDVGLASLFDVIVGSRIGLRAKPETDLLELTLQCLGITAKNCIYVGDGEVDAEVAERAGLDFAWVKYGYAKPDWNPVKYETFECFFTLSNAIMHKIMQT